MKLNNVSGFSKKITSTIGLGFSFQNPMVQKIEAVENSHSPVTI